MENIKDLPAKSKIEIGNFRGQTRYATLTTKPEWLNAINAHTAEAITESGKTRNFFFDTTTSRWLLA